MIRALTLSALAAATMTACSGNDVRDAFAGLPVASDPVGATVYVGRQKVGTTPLNIPDSAWERPGGRVGNIGILRVIAPGCGLKTVPVNLAREGEEAFAELNCNGDESYRPSDLGFLEKRSVGQLITGADDRASDKTLEALRGDELHVIYNEGRLDDLSFRAMNRQ